MTDADIIRTLDRLEADMRSLESRIYSVRSTLRDRIDPHKQRKDLGYWYDDDALRPNLTGIK